MGSIKSANACASKVIIKELSSPLAEWEELLQNTYLVRRTLYPVPAC